MTPDVLVWEAESDQLSEYIKQNQEWDREDAVYIIVPSQEKHASLARRLARQLSHDYYAVYNENTNQEFYVTYA